MRELHYRMVIVLVNGTEIAGRETEPAKDILHNDKGTPVDLDSFGEIISHGRGYIALDSKRGPVVVLSRRVSHIYYERVYAKFFSVAAQ